MASRILTVDDSPTVRQLLGTTLMDAGYEVVEAKDGEEALKIMENQHVDMLVTDLNMPKLDGIGLVKQVRKLPGHRFMPIIMLTTETNDEFKRQGKVVGASGWIVKPFRPEQVLGVVRMVMPRT
ncbi:MAG: two-component system response regulator [Desulfuromonas sp.]|nr:MAG: two-component system response regulator [Desulfuromonas sp.]